MPRQPKVTTQSLTAERVPRDGRRTALAIQEAAAELFRAKGYEATSLREIADVVGIQVGSLYNHMSGKEELLSSIMIGVIENLLQALDAAIKDAVDPVDRLQKAIDCHIRFHATHQRETFIGNSEMRSLGEEDLKRVRALRRSYETQLQEILESAASAGGGDVLDIKLQVYSMLAQGAHIASWYRPTKDNLQHVVDVYTEFLFRQLQIAR